MRSAILSLDGELSLQLFDRLKAAGWSVRERDGTDPELIEPDGCVHAAWRTGYPYAEKLDAADYAASEARLLGRLGALMDASAAAGRRCVVVVEGPDAAGKSGFVRRLARVGGGAGPAVVRMPPLAERGDDYLAVYRRAIDRSTGLQLFDRSWYRRPVLEVVMGYCDPAEAAEEVLERVVRFEESLCRSGVELVKCWLDLSRAEQAARLAVRRLHPRLRHTLSEHDIAAWNRWDDLAAARDAALKMTDRPGASWMVVQANDKKRARIALMQHVLRTLAFDGCDGDLVGSPDPAICASSPHR